MSVDRNATASHPLTPPRLTGRAPIRSVCMLGNRTISGHQLGDGQCSKTFLQQSDGPLEEADNFTMTNGERRPQGDAWEARE